LPRAAPERSEAPRVQPFRTSGVGPVLSEAIARVDAAKTKLPNMAATIHRRRSLSYLCFRIVLHRTSALPNAAFRFCSTARPQVAPALPKAALVLTCEARVRTTLPLYRTPPFDFAQPRARRSLPLYQRPLWFLHVKLASARRFRSTEGRLSILLSRAPAGRPRSALALCFLPISRPQDASLPRAAPERSEAPRVHALPHE
jgi:hypothetical protein